MNERLTRAKAIRMKCLDCCCGSSLEVNHCPTKDCPLWRYRRGIEERDELYIPRKNNNNTEEEEIEYDI